MRITSFIFFVFISIVIIRCSSSQKMVYDLPSNLSEENKVALLSQIKRGENLYKVHCHTCHAALKHTDSVLDFSVKQLTAYESSLILNDQLNHSVTRTIFPHDLTAIMTYLTYNSKRKPAN